jgi:hypothetical protein
LGEFYWTALVSLMHLALPYAITRADRARLGPRELARAWNTASWASAIVFFGPLALPAHFFVTRRTVRGLLVGILWCAALLALDELAELGIEMLS